MINVSIAIIERMGRILIAKRKAGGSLGQLWEFPGGKIEPHETPQQCLKRELSEELGINATIGDLICATKHAYQDTEVSLSVFKVCHFTGDISLNSHDEIKWVVPSALKDYAFPDANVPIIRKLMAGDRKE